MIKLIHGMLALITLYLLITSPALAHQTPVIIKMTGNGFDPPDVTLDQDTAIIFDNADSKDHWPASDVHPTHDIYPEFDPTKPIRPNETWKFQPNRVGNFKYHDHLNPHIRGILNIIGIEVPGESKKADLNFHSEVDRVLDSKMFSLKAKNEDPNSYLQNVMDYCFQKGGRDNCYKDLAYILSYQFDLSGILDLLAKNENHEGVFARCHELTHYLTRLAYKKEQNITTIYDQCTSVCHGGCYHGAIEQYLQDKKLSLNDSDKLKAEIPKVCGQSKDYKVPLLYDECIHGIGHGTMYINDADLMSALKLCDLLPDPRDRQNCYSGAFMENSSSSTNLDHPSKYLKPDDPMYPCDILDKKYLDMCYRYQSSHFAIITQSNWQETAKLCLKVPKDYQRPCFLTIGSNQVGFTQDFPTIAKDCELMPSSSTQADCIQGAVDALAIRYRGDFQKGTQFCSMINPMFQPACFMQYGISISSWSADPNSRISLCNSIPKFKNAAWCQGNQTLSSPLIIIVKQLLVKLKPPFNFFVKTKPDTKTFQALSFEQQTSTLKQISSTNGPDKAWEYLISTFKNENGSSGSVHDLAHLLGGLNFEHQSFAGLKTCTPNFAFGCFHGFLDKAFSKSLEKLAEAQKACLLAGPAGSGPFASCIHGIGHGVASFYQTTGLENSLIACDKLSDGATYCYDGVFMEFARNSATSFYHQDDPLYPCNNVDQKYVFSCGRNQVRVMIDRLKLTFKNVADICTNSQNADFQKSCFTALGFDAVARVYGNPEGVINLCASIKSLNGRNECIKSASGELIFQNISGWQISASKLCQSLDYNFQKDCFRYTDQIKREYSRS